jgi:hypothetical protein
VSKQTLGNEDLRDENSKAENVGQGLKQGVTGFGTEIFKGIGGVFTKPVEGAKKGGVAGFAKGIGKGVAGAVSSPFTGLFRATESVSQGISGTATNIQNLGKSQLELLDPRQVRTRPARRIDHKGQISKYNLDVAIINAYL